MAPKRQIDHETAEQLFRAAAGVLEWNARMGGFDAPCWEELRQAFEARRRALASQRDLQREEAVKLAEVEGREGGKSKMINQKAARALLEAAKDAYRVLVAVDEAGEYTLTKLRLAIAACEKGEV